MRINEIKIVTQLDRGLAYAEACFETFRVLNGQVFQQAAHQQRLQYGLESYGFNCSDADVNAWFTQVIAEACTQGNDILVRMTVSGGDAGWGLVRQSDKAAADMHIQVQLMPSVKRHDLHLQSMVWPFPLREKKVKYTSDYAESLRAIVQWKLDHPMQALICSDAGHVLSTLTANIAIYRHDQWYTPVGDGILSGVVQQFLLRNKLLVACECPVSWLHDCEALVCMNSGVFVQPVASVNGRGLSLNHPAMDSLLAVFDGELGVVNMGVMGE